MFFFLFELASCCRDIISFTFRGKLSALSTLSLQTLLLLTPLPFFPSIINFYHHLAGELVFPLRQHVTLPTHNIKQCPCTAITLRLCPLPACDSQRSSSLQIKELCHLCPFSSSSFSSRLSQACVFQGQGMLLIRKHLLCYLFHTYFLQSYG